MRVAAWKTKLCKITPIRATILLAGLILSTGAARSAETSSGSGIIVSTKGEIVTNAHVVTACETIRVKLGSGDSKTGALVARDERNDLAVVRVTGVEISVPSVAVFREGVPLRAGDTIVALGYPLSGILAAEASVSVGNVSALAGLADDSRYVQISAPVQPGNSGGPLLDASGHLVGIVTAKLDALRMARFTGDIPQNVNFALKVEVARTFLDSKRILYQTARSDGQLSPADVGSIARSFTVRIECKRGAVTSQDSAKPLDRVGSGPPQSAVGPRPTEQEDWCTRPSKFSPDLVIKGCTVTIEYGRGLGLPIDWAFLSRGAAYYKKGAFDRAVNDLTDAIRLDPQNRIAFGYRGMAYSKKHDLDRAISDYTEAIRLDWKEAFFLRGEAYYEMGQFDRAIFDYSEAVRANPKDVLAFFARGNAYLKKGDYASVFSDFRIVAESKNAPTDMAAEAATGIGLMYQRGEGVSQDDNGQAMRWFLVGAGNGSEIAMSEIAFLYAEVKDCYSARQWLEKAAAAGSEAAKRTLRSGIVGPCQW